MAANQSDEIVVVDKTGKVIAKLGDFDGLVDDGMPKGLLFPATPDFSRDGKTLYVTESLRSTCASAPAIRTTSRSTWAWTAKVSMDRVEDRHAI